MFSWDVLAMDTDFHEVYAEGNTCINPPKPIIIGNNVWIGCRSLVLKGVEIYEGTVVAANTTLTKSIHLSHAMIGGNPARIIKENIKWKQ